MILCIDVGNTNILGGIFGEDGGVIDTFRYDTIHFGSADQFGTFLLNLLSIRKIRVDEIRSVAMCSVVPNLSHLVTEACIEYLHLSPLVLTSMNNGLVDVSHYVEPQTLGADLIAYAIAAVKNYPNENVIVVGLGTASTISVISKDKKYLGSIIWPGLRISMESLARNAAQLFQIQIEKPATLIGNSTEASIKSGLFYSQIATIKELTKKIMEEYFKNDRCIILGTGGFSSLFSDETVFTKIEPLLVLQGLYYFVLNSTLVL